MANTRPKRRPSGTDKAGATAAPVPKALNDDDKRVRGKPVSLHPLSFKEALRLMIKTPPLTKKPRKKRRKRAP